MYSVQNLNNNLKMIECKNVKIGNADIALITLSILIVTFFNF